MFCLNNLMGDDMNTPLKGKAALHPGKLASNPEPTGATWAINRAWTGYENLRYLNGTGIQMK